MPEENEALVRSAYEAYGRGDMEARSFTGEGGQRR
jgi:hypothetical protein